MLDYDNNAFYYFSITLLSLYLIPGVWFALSEIFQAFFGRGEAARTEDEEVKVKKLKKNTNGIARLKQTAFLTNLAVLCVAIPLFFYLLNLVRSDGEVNTFDPFSILGINTEATKAEIRQAYRRLSLKFHPDKNPGNKVAEEMFVKLTKAYEALTDEVAKENFKRFGNPDGKQSLEVSIGLPRFVLDNPKVMLILYLVGMVVVIPLGVGLWYSNSTQFGEKNIMYLTYSAFYELLKKDVKLTDLPEVLAASAEFRLVNASGSCAGLPKLYRELKSEGAFADVKFLEHPVVLRGNVLLHAHLFRKTKGLNQDQLDDIDRMLVKAPDVLDGLIDIAHTSRLLDATFNTIRMSQLLVQGLWETDHFLKQLPHLEKAHIDLLGSNVQSMTDFLNLPDEEKLSGVTLSDKKRKDILKTCSLLPCLDIKHQLVVEEDEAEEGEVIEKDADQPNGFDVYEEDLVTLKITLTRKNLTGKSATAEPVLAPRISRSLKEGWWLILTDKVSSEHSHNRKKKDAPKPNIHAVEKVTDQGREVVHELRFLAPPKTGNYSMVLHVLSDCYVGMDKTIEFSYDVKPKSQLPVYKPHQEDVDLDLQPTLFEMVTAAADDSSDDEDEDETK